MDQRRLAMWLQNRHPGWVGQSIGAVRKLRAGWESDVYRFELSHGPPSGRATEGLVVRLYVGEQSADKAQREFAGMRLLGQAGYPVPQVVGVEPSPGPLGRPFLVMAFVEGDADWPWSAQDRIPLLARLLHRLHAVDWRAFVDRDEHEALAAGLGVERTLQGWRAAQERFPIRGFGAVLAWLEERLAGLPRVEPAVVHWDFHPGNVMVADDGSARVVDWTQVGVTDPRFDLAWSGLLMRESQGHDALRPAYEHLSGAVSDMAFFDVAARWKRLYSIVVSLDAGPEVFGMRAGAADLMRQQIPALRPSYEAMAAMTGIAIPEVEALLAGA